MTISTYRREQRFSLIRSGVILAVILFTAPWVVRLVIWYWRKIL